VSEHELAERCEAYKAQVPAGGLHLTIGADVQPDRVEAEVVAWGAGEESWSIGYYVFHGDPDISEGQRGSPWDALTDLVRTRFKHESGVELPASYTFLDSSGHNTQSVYEYVRAHRADKIFAIKGRGGQGIPIVGSPSKKRSGKTKRTVDLYILGVDNAKSVIQKRLSVKEGPGRCHFPIGREIEWFRQLTAEKIMTKFVKGFPRREWVKPSGVRNEALDCRVYAYAALVMSAPRMDRLAAKLKTAAAALPPQEPNEPEVTGPQELLEPAKNTLDATPSPVQSEPKARRAKRRPTYSIKW
jgi:phage terminase large subunit GpA-like protein